MIQPRITWLGSQAFLLVTRYTLGTTATEVGIFTISHNHSFTSCTVQQWIALPVLHCSQLNRARCAAGRTCRMTGCSSATEVRPCSTNLLPVLGDLDGGRPLSCGTRKLPYRPLFVDELEFDPSAGWFGEAVLVISSGDTGLGPA